MELSSMEYKKIAQFYNIPKPSDKTYKEIAEDVLAGKLCKCIKKVQSRQKVLEKRKREMDSIRKAKAGEQK